MFRRFLSLFRRLVGGGQERSSGDRPENERRVWVRYPSSAQAVVKPVQDGVNTRLSGRVRNVSRGGIHLVVNHKLEPGDMISVELPGSPPGETETVLACVIRVDPTDDKQWAVGCTFSEELSEEELSAFGAKKERPSKPENRAWKRFGCSVQATCSLVSDPGKTWPAEVVNISAGGIGLQVNQAVETGAVLSLRLAHEGGQVERTVLACVVHVVARPGGEWVLGCNFIHELSDADLKALQ